MGKKKSPFILKNIVYNCIITVHFDDTAELKIPCTAYADRRRKFLLYIRKKIISLVSVLWMGD